jgi:branched-chain amino acid transport system substrate-binding protein
VIRARRALAVATVVAWWLLHAATAAVLAQAPGAPGDDAPRPWREGVRQPLEFRGETGEEPEPDVPEVALGWFGPDDPDHPAFGTSWRGALLALEEENATGGYRPAAAGAPLKPFRLLPVWSESPWQAGIGSLLRLVYDARLRAVIGGVDGTTTHLALQVALKSHFTLVTPGSSDASTERAHVPWLFSLVPSDEAQAAAIVPAVIEASGGRPFAVAASAEHEGHAALDAFTREWTKHDVAPGSLVHYPPGDVAPSVSRVLASRPSAVLVLGPGPAAGAFARQLRAAGYGGALFGGGTATGRAFLAAAGEAAEGFVAPCWTVPGPPWDAFAAAYERRWRDSPDPMAASAYDAVRLVAAAVRRAGPNRARIRDAVAALVPWGGAAGPIRFNPVGRNVPPVWLGSWQGARFARR